jgi:hypothetical protein
MLCNTALGSAKNPSNRRKSQVMPAPAYETGLRPHGSDATCKEHSKGSVNGQRYASGQAPREIGAALERASPEADIDNALKHGEAEEHEQQQQQWRAGPQGAATHHDASDRTHAKTRKPRAGAADSEEAHGASSAKAPAGSKHRALCGEIGSGEQESASADNSRLRRGHEEVDGGKDAKRQKAEGY